MGLRRVEVQVPERDVPLVRAVAAALLDPERAGITRALLLTRLGPEPSRRLKFLLAASPLGGVETDQETPGQAG